VFQGVNHRKYHDIIAVFILIVIIIPITVTTHISLIMLTQNFQKLYHSHPNATAQNVLHLIAKNVPEINLLALYFQCFSGGGAYTPACKWPINSN